MEPIWKMISGEFFGWRQGDDLFDDEGTHVGYFKGDTAFSLKGEYVGEMVDEERMGAPVGRTPRTSGARGSRGNIRSVPRADISPRQSKAWEDPEIE